MTATKDQGNAAEFVICCLFGLFIVFSSIGSAESALGFRESPFQWSDYWAVTAREWVMAATLLPIGLGLIYLSLQELRRRLKP